MATEDIMSVIMDKDINKDMETMDKRVTMDWNKAYNRLVEDNEEYYHKYEVSKAGKRSLEAVGYGVACLIISSLAGAIKEGMK